jgi:hypothetical protein
LSDCGFLLCHVTDQPFRNQEPNEFIGATDSAVPCAILLDLARVIPRTLPDLAVDIVFFDGEEAFETWTATDSLCTQRTASPRLCMTFVLIRCPEQTVLGIWLRSGNPVVGSHAFGCLCCSI